MKERTKKDREPLLDISTTIGVGAPIRIDGRRCYVHHPDRLSLQQRLVLEDVTPRTGELLQRVNALTHAETRELSGLLDRACRIVCDAPTAVQDKLRDADRIAILQVFTGLRFAAPRPTGATTRPMTHRSTGGRSSRGSRGSTAVRRSSGVVNRSES